MRHKKLPKLAQDENRDGIMENKVYGYVMKQIQYKQTFHEYFENTLSYN